MNDQQHACGSLQRCCACLQAFGNQAAPVFVLLLPHQRNWKPVTLQIIMVAHVSLEYQLWARPT